jgi:hypothetical protein
MIINYLHIVSVIVAPIKTNSPLNINSDAVLSGSVSDEFFQTIGGRYPQIVYAFSVIYHSQPPSRSGITYRMAFTIRKFLIESDIL